MLQILFAFLAGILTVAAPCILPVLPIVLGGALGGGKRTRPLFIVAGFVSFFTVSALALSYLVSHSGFDSNIIRLVGIVILIVFGLLMIWPKPFELLAARLSPIFSKIGTAAGTGNRGNGSAFLLGAALGLVWTPCAGPVLASILTLIALEQELLASAILLFAYALGAGLPMLAIAYGGHFISSKVSAVARHAILLQRIFGVLIIALAVAMYFGLDTKAYSYLLQYVPVLNPKL